MAFGQEAVILPKCWPFESTCFSFHQPGLSIIGLGATSSQILSPGTVPAQLYLTDGVVSEARLAAPHSTCRELARVL